MSLTRTSPSAPEAIHIEHRPAPGARASRDPHAWRVVRSPRPWRFRRVLGVLPSAVLGVLLLVLWQVLVSSGTVSAFLLPHPSDVARSFWDALSSGLFWDYTRTTLTESMLGFAAGAAFALPVGYGIARSPLLARALERMPQAERTVLSLYYHEELTLREIAKVMDLHESRISQLKTQGLLRLRACLDRKWNPKGQEKGK